VNPTRKDSVGKQPHGTTRSRAAGRVSVVLLVPLLLACSFPRHAMAQSAERPTPQAPNGLPDSLRSSISAAEQQQSDSRLSGRVDGTVVDPSGAAVAGARVKLTGENHRSDAEILTGDDGQFSFASVPPGPFQLTITSVAFAPQTSSGVLQPGEIFMVPPIVLAVATEITQVQVVLPRVELAEEEVKDQEKQRVFGVIPNFYVSYVPEAVPLTSKQKFGLAWKTTIDPVNFGVVAVIAGVQQAQNDFKGYGQGAEGYGKRYGASYADFVSDTFIGGAIFPSLLKQDPRYFYKGTGTTRSRILYALANSVICKGDNGHWQANYSSIAGSLAAGGISNLYYPANDRGAALVFENTLIGIGETAATNLLQEFLIRKLTSNLPNNNRPSKP
jgi:Carboxypeptidase regulatory-like domain